MSKHRGAKGVLIESYTKKRSVGQRKVIRTTLGELIAAVTDEVKPIIHSPSRLYNWVSWILMICSLVIRSAAASSHGKTPKLFANNLVRTN
jgi:hypothetical protein